jgi:hypothetical protein
MSLEEDVIDFCNAIEAATVNLKHRIAQRHGVDVKEETKPEKTTVPEKTFDLTYVKRTGAKIGEFEIADEKDSPKDLYDRALNILKQNGATISKRYHGDGYVYAYWEYQNKIWRQKLKK